MRTLKPSNILIKSEMIKRFISTLSRNRVPEISSIAQSNIHRNKSSQPTVSSPQPPAEPHKSQQYEKPAIKIIKPKEWDTPEYFKKERERMRDGSYPMDTLGNMERGLSVDELKQFLNEPDNIRAFMQSIPGEIRKTKELLRETFIEGPEIVQDPEDHIKMLFTFDSEEKLKKFNVTSDSDHDVGISTASLTTTKSGSGLFSGYLCNKLKPDGITKWAGYANFTSKRETWPFWIPSYFNWEDYNHFVFKVRGDGRSYSIILSSPGHFEQDWGDQYHYILYTRGGPYWQISKIPFSKFYYAPLGGMHPWQSEGMTKDRIARFGITLADGNEGPFSLEIDYIGLQNKRGHFETFAYEHYNVDHAGHT